jgi:hypothetical protein
LPQIIGYVGYNFVAMQVFSLWFCWFVDFSLVHCLALLNVFVEAEACCLAVGHQDYSRAFLVT